jgi:hypothetical protein
MNYFKKSRTRCDAAISFFVIVINVLMFFLLPILPLPPGRLGQAAGIVMVINGGLIFLSLLTRMWISSASLIVSAAFYFILLGMG